MKKPTLLTITALLALGSCTDPSADALTPLESAHPAAAPSVYARIMSRITGVHHTREDIDRMGLPAVQIIMSRDAIRRAEAELALGADPERTRELEDWIATSREIIEVLTWMEMPGVLADGGDDDFCQEEPRISSASTPQDIDRSADDQVRVSASGRHSTEDDAMHTVATVTNIVDKRTGDAVSGLSDLDVERDGSCLRRFSPYTDTYVSVPKDHEDLEHLCAASWSNHRAVTLNGDPEDRKTSPPLHVCDDLGERNPSIHNPRRW